MNFNINCKEKSVLDPGFLPAVLWNKAFKELVQRKKSVPLIIGLKRTDNTFSRFETQILPFDSRFDELNTKYVERLIKFLLWQKGGYQVLLSRKYMVDIISKMYCKSGKRFFDYEFIGKKIYGLELEIQYCAAADFPKLQETSISLGRNFNGCRIGFDLGGSDRKAAALIDGKVVYSEEIKWNPYFEKDPSYHFEGINDSLRRAAEHLPRVDAIGGSAAGVYVNNEVRAASLFRGIDAEEFEKHIRRIFFDLKKIWNDIPFEVVNDGEVTALAGSMSLNDSAVLGISMGTSMAAGYVTPEGNITPWLNELAFAPIDYRENAPVDEWSGDIGCGVQYFSQQCVARLADLAGIKFEGKVPLPDKLVKVQELMSIGDERASKIYETIGVYFGYAIAHYADFYDFRNLLVLGRVTTGRGGEIIIEKAKQVLQEEFPSLYSKIRMVIPDEKEKRHGQAIAAASLPLLSRF